MITITDHSTRARYKANMHDQLDNEFIHGMLYRRFHPHPLYGVHLKMKRQALWRHYDHY